VALGVFFVFVPAAFVAEAAWAEPPTKICVPEASSRPVLSTNAKGECPPTGAKPAVSYKPLALPGPEDLEVLAKVLRHVKFIDHGVAGKPTVQFSAVNVQIVNGRGETESTNGEGNLVIGYDENPSEVEETGSHDLILGFEQRFTSFGSILAGAENSAVAPFAVVLGGPQNRASGEFSSIAGGAFNQASGPQASVSGGAFNLASGLSAGVGGGKLNRAGGEHGWVGGGAQNRAEGRASSIFGGKELTAKNEYEAIP
jgi:hypothetical protein